MLKEYAAALRRSMICADIVVSVAGFVLSYAFVTQWRVLYAFSAYFWLIPVLSLYWVLAFHYLGLYDSIRMKTVPELLIAITKAGVGGFLLFGSLFFTVKAIYVSRYMIGFNFMITCSLFLLERLLIVKLVHAWRKRGYNYRSLLVVGTGRRAQQFIDRVENNRHWGLKILGLIDQKPELLGTEVKGYAVVGTLNEMQQVIHEHVVDEVVFVVPRSMLHDIEGPMQACEVEGVKVSVALDFFDMRYGKPVQDNLDDMPLISFEIAPRQVWGLQLKRLVDMALAGLSLLGLSPVMLLVALAVKISSPGPVFFKQRRCGMGGRTFTLYKFRTMVEGAEERLAELQRQNEMQGPVFKMTQDPRITPVGKFLRKYSLDELPQIWNVLRGDMSLVGPRPPIPDEVSKYESWQRRRLRMRPGLTCLWQVQGRNQITNFEDWARLDLEYIDNWSLGLDWKIIARTVPVVFSGSGAK